MSNRLKEITEELRKSRQKLTESLPKNQKMLEENAAALDRRRTLAPVRPPAEERRAELRGAPEEAPELGAELPTGVMKLAPAGPLRPIYTEADPSTPVLAAVARPGATDEEREQSSRESLVQQQYWVLNSMHELRVELRREELRPALARKRDASSALSTTTDPVERERLNKVIADADEVVAEYERKIVEIDKQAKEMRERPLEDFADVGQSGVGFFGIGGKPQE